MIEINLKELSRKALQLENENKRFSNFLRTIPSETLDSKATDLFNTIEPQIDCKSCANCCKNMHAALLPEELSIISDQCGITEIQFKADYLQPYKEAFYFGSKPCPLLTNENLCKVYEFRPSCCQTFPNLVGDHFKYRFRSILEKYPICPIVYHVVEQLKITFGFKLDDETTTND